MTIFGAALSFWVVACGTTGVLESIGGIEVIGVGMPGVFESVGGAKVIQVGVLILAGVNFGAGGRVGSCGVGGWEDLSIYGCTNLIPILVSFSATWGG